ncbi:unnamed protein product [Prorocentrum cordatum]|uniref:Uncharacterized protein n=1 Tax=Prorocentrum cordatum TaxID=2364126 RepID=A0ABN9QPC1_9DINO|nr:unnamed protein product [Polarella glacialis]
MKPSVASAQQVKSEGGKSERPDAPHSACTANVAKNWARRATAMGGSYSETPEGLHNHGGRVTSQTQPSCTT